MRTLLSLFSILGVTAIAWKPIPALSGPNHTEANVTSSNERSVEDHSHESGVNAHAHDHSEEEGEKHEEHTAESGGHNEGNTTISSDSAKRMGIKVGEAGTAVIGQTVPLTGRITLNENTKAEIRARFPGIVRAVKVNLAEKVKKGQVLAVIESNESLKNYNVIAPIDGTILSRSTNVGDVANGDSLFLIADLSNVWAKFHIFPQDADAIKVGQSVEVHTLGNGKRTKGKIDLLFPTADELSQTLIAIVDLSNADHGWKPGMAIEGDVTVSQTQVDVAVKEVAVHALEDEGDVVFAVDGNDYKVRPVKVGLKGSGYVEILKGLEAGEHYAAEGSFIIKSDILKSTAAHSH